MTNDASQGAADRSPALASDTLKVVLKYEGSHASSTYSDQLWQKWLTMMAHTAGARRRRPQGTRRGASSLASPTASATAGSRPSRTSPYHPTAHTNPRAPNR
jgi:hypothetical protein